MADAAGCLHSCILPSLLTFLHPPSGFKHSFRFLINSARPHACMCGVRKHSVTYYRDPPSPFSGNNPSDPRQETCYSRGIYCTRYQVPGNTFLELKLLSLRRGCSTLKLPNTVRVNLNEECFSFFFSIFPKFRYFPFPIFKIPKFREKLEKTEKQSSLRLTLTLNITFDAYYTQSRMFR